VQALWIMIEQAGPLGMAAAAVAALVGLSVLAGLVHSLVTASRGWTLAWAAVGWLGGLGVGLVAWTAARRGHELIQAALAGVDPAERNLLALRGHYEAMQATELALWGLVLPLGVGAFLLVRGLLLPGGPTAERAPARPDPAVPEAAGSRAPLFAAIGCAAAGIGLGLWAITDVQRFGDFVAALMLGL